MFYIFFLRHVTHSLSLSLPYRCPPIFSWHIAVNFFLSITQTSLPNKISLSDLSFCTLKTRMAPPVSFSLESCQTFWMLAGKTSKGLGVGVPLLSTLTTNARERTNIIHRTSLDSSLLPSITKSNTVSNNITFFSRINCLTQITWNCIACHFLKLILDGTVHTFWLCKSVNHTYQYLIFTFHFRVKIVQAHPVYLNFIVTMIMPLKRI